MTFDELLAAFGVRRVTPASRSRINTALDTAGVKCYPDVRTTDDVRQVALTAPVSREPLNQPSKAPVSTGATALADGQGEGRSLWHASLAVLTLLGIPSLIASLVLLSPGVKQFFSKAEWNISHGFDGYPSCSDPGWLREVKPTVSHAQKQVSDEYAPENTLDDDVRTAWMEKWRGDGGPDFIGWQFARRFNIRLVCIRNGWTRDTAVYNGTGRPKSVRLVGYKKSKEIKSCGKVHRFDADARDYKAYQTLRFACDRASGAGLYIRSGYPPDGQPLLTGTYVAISDVRFYYER
jgi:hypothetical protein